VVSCTDLCWCVEWVSALPEVGGNSTVFVVVFVTCDAVEGDKLTTDYDVSWESMLAMITLAWNNSGSIFVMSRKASKLVESTMSMSIFCG